MNTDGNYIAGVMRAIVPAIVAWLVGRGYISPDAAGDVVAAVVAIAAAVWSVVSKRPTTTV